MTEANRGRHPEQPAGGVTPPAAKRLAEAVQVTAHEAAGTAHQLTEAVQTSARQVTAAAQQQAQQATVPPRVARRRTRLFLGIAVGALATFAGLAVVIHGHHENSIDLHVTRAVQRQHHRRPWLDAAMRWVSAPGFAPWSWLLPGLAAGLLRWLGFRLEAGFMVATGLASAIVAGIKIVLARPRPSHPEVIVTAPLTDYSFPSGHTVQYAAQFGYLAYLAFALLRPGWLRRVGVALCGSLVALVGPSRVGLGQHWASDVLASYLLGTAFLIGHIGLYRRLKARQRPVARGTSMTVPADEAPRPSVPASR